MVNVVTCPNCGQNLKVADSFSGQGLRCPMCATIFAPPTMDDAFSASPRQLPVLEPSQPPAALAVPDEVDLRSRRKPPVADDLGGRRRTRPARTEAPEKSNAVLLFVISAGATLALGLGVLAIFWFVRPMPKINPAPLPPAVAEKPIMKVLPPRNFDWPAKEKVVVDEKGPGIQKDFGVNKDFADEKKDFFLDKKDFPIEKKDDFDKDRPFEKKDFPSKDFPPGKDGPFEKNDPFAKKELPPEKSDPIKEVNDPVFQVSEPDDPAGTATLLGAKFLLEAVAFTPDGQTLRTFHRPNKLTRWSVAPAKALGTILLEQAMTHEESCVFSADGKFLAITSMGGTIRVIDTATGRPVVRFFDDAARRQRAPIQFSRDGNLLVTGQKDVKVWDLAEKRLRWTRIHGEPPTSLAFSPDGKFVAATTMSLKFRVYDALTSQELANIQAANWLPGKREHIWALAFSPDGKTLITGGITSFLQFWDWRADSSSIVLENVGKGRASAAICEDKNMLVFGMGDTKVHFLDLKTGAERASLNVGKWTFDSRLAMSSSGATLAVGMQGNVRLFNVAKIILQPADKTKDDPKDPPKFVDPKDPPQKQFDGPAEERKPDDANPFPQPRGVIQGVDITPPVMKDQRLIVHLPAPINNLTVGGAGRFLIVNFPSKKKLGVFDVNHGKLSYCLDMDDENPHIAAGIDKLAVSQSPKRDVQRWNLRTGKREVTFPIAEPGTITGLAMGSGSSGPLLACLKSEDGKGVGALYDMVRISNMSPNLGNKLNGDLNLPRASANGLVFAMRKGGPDDPHVVTVLSLDGVKAIVTDRVMINSMLLPGPEGFMLYGPAVYHRSRKLMYPTIEPVAAGPSYIPAVHGPYSLLLSESNVMPGFGRVEVHMGLKKTPIYVFDALEGVTAEQPLKGGFPKSLTHDQRVHLIPKANVLITIPPTNDRLVLHRFDADTALEKSNTNYIYVNSEPTRVAVKGLTYTYRMEVRSKRGGLTYQLTSGPPGMEVSPAGVVTWAVPNDFVPAQSTVAIMIRDRAGQELRYGFTIRISEK